MIETAVAAFPNFKAVATTLRNATTATVNDWGAVLWHDGTLYQAPTRDGLEILDRVGGGRLLRVGRDLRLPGGQGSRNGPSSAALRTERSP